LKKLLIFVLFVLVLISSVSVSAEIDWENDVEVYLPLANVYSSTTGLTDLSSRGNDGSAYGGITFTNSSQESYYFDGSDDDIILNSNSGLQLISNYTLSAWIKLDSSFANSGSLISKDSSSNERAYTFEVYSTKILRFYIGGGGTAGVSIIQMTDTLKLDQIYFITAVYDKVLKIYINGVLNVSGTGDAPPTPTGSSTLQIGSREYSSHRDFFNGEIQNIKIYNRAISQTEIFYLYSQGRNYNPYESSSSISVKDIYTNSTKYNFSVTFKDLTNSTKWVVNSSDGIVATIKLNTSKQYQINITSLNGGFADSSKTINGTSQYTFYVYPYNSIDFFVYDEESLDLINTSTTTLYYSLDGSSSDTSSTNGTFSLVNLTSGFWELRGSNSDYYDRYYYYTLLDGSHYVQKMYLINTSTGLLRNVYVYCEGAGQTNVTVSFYKQLNSTWVSMAQRITDGTGLAPFYLNPSTTYRMIINYNDGTYTNDFTPSATPIEVEICGDTSVPFNWTSIYDKFDYLISPEDSLISSTNHTFNLSVSSPGGYINSFEIRYNDSVSDSLSGSASGGEVSINLDLNNKTGTYTIYYSFNISGEEEIYNISKIYRIKGFDTAGNNSLVTSFENFSSDIPVEWRYIIITLFAIIIMVFFYRFVDPLVNSFIGFAVFIIFGLLGWINMLYLIPMGALLFMYYLVDR